MQLCYMHIVAYLFYLMVWRSVLHSSTYTGTLGGTKMLS